MKITPRMKQILQALLEEKEPISIKHLAEKTGISKRTVQRELESVNDVLLPYGMEFASKTGVGVWLAGDEAARAGILAEAASSDEYAASSKEDRRKRLVLEILREKTLRKLYYYSRKFGVSEATISTDLEAVEAWLSHQGLSMVRKPGSGIEVEGTEENYRRAIRFFIGENIDTKLFRQLYDGDGGENYAASLQKNHLGRLLDKEILRRVHECLEGMDNQRMENLTENAYDGLVIHLAIAINRILQQDVIQVTGDWQEKMPRDEDYRLAEDIAAELEAEFEVSIPQLEIAYICLHLKGAKHEKIQLPGREERMELADRELRQFVNDLIDAYDGQQAYLLKQDDEFMQGLLAHLQPTIVRLVHGMSIQNPVLADIKENYSEIYARCQRAAQVLADKVGRSVPEEEIGFLAVHFGAALVRLEGRKEQIRKVQVAVVCSSGIGLSRLMAAKLEKVFKDRLEMTTYGKHDITPAVEAKIDFIISSLQLEAVQVPVVYVNPLLSEADIGEIRCLIYQFERLPRKEGTGDRHTAPFDEVNRMAACISSVIKHLRCFQAPADITFDRLLFTIGERMTVQSERQEMIVDALAKREQVSSQIFAEFGFALLHARTNGVTRPSFAVCLPEGGSCFQNSYFKEISVVLVMLVPVDDSLEVNTGIMGYISSMLIEEPDFLATAAGGNEEIIRQELSGHLNRYFKEYLGKLA
ncbi:MAG: BglG family transcription antiterminator [Anaerovibrio sp.]|uniref:BglG family transcription antiterminator n=1 Tax=Anaerovibrio sp. TaxID=1872532 RepID=UPI002617641F|nr:BglG family transcription antiterminator [Anaerovibrio sp.]MDD7677369.1 BglG family transcription antiterminator [Anaerovibrio sp.]MDY2603417.1 BglG family transcription antiterminator [Anaerovibrio sp.]